MSSDFGMAAFGLFGLLYIVFILFIVVLTIVFIFKAMSFMKKKTLLDEELNKNLKRLLDQNNENTNQSD